MRELERETTHSAALEAVLQPIVLIGRGRVGGALLKAAHGAGIEATLLGRELPEEALGRARVALLCVPDAEIEAAATALAERAPALEFAGHTSGAGGLGLLTPVAGARPFSLHPLQTIPDAGSPVAGAPAAIAGESPAALALARGLAEALGMRPFEVPESSRAAYHAAASIASNFLIAIEETAVEILDRAGVPGGRELLSPLVLRTAANWSERGAEALTGPIARGDTGTVERHLEALRSVGPELAATYEALAERTEAVARGGERS